jgi:hypothetical protein
MARGMIEDDEKSKALVGTHVLTRAFEVERVKGIEPSLSAWEQHKITLRGSTRPGQPEPERPGVTSVGTA